MNSPVNHFIQSWVLWVITLNFVLVFIIRPKFIFSPRQRVKMSNEQSPKFWIAFFIALFLSATLLGSSTYFLRLNNLYLVIPEQE